MKLKFKGVEYTLSDAGVADMVAFERHFQLPSSVMGDSSVSRVEWMCFLAWRGLKRAGAVDLGAFDDDFLDNLEFVNDDEDEVTTTEDPTAQEALAS